MVVEHTFVTTMEADDALRAASAMLAGFGFTVRPQTSFSVGPPANNLEVFRGTAKYRRAHGVRNWPQQVRLEWDRGRVDLAVSITPPPRGRLDTDPTKLRGKELAAVQRLLLAIAHALEMLLASGYAADEASAALLHLELQLEQEAQRAKRRNRIILMVVLIFFTLCIGALVVAIVNSMPGHHW